MTTTYQKPPTRGRIAAATMLAAGAAAAAMLFAAADANAQPVKPIPENTIKSECKEAGGTYSTSPPNKQHSKRWSECKYKDGDGNMVKDLYVNGVPWGTVPA